jgi:hypothetical protein
VSLAHIPHPQHAYPQFPHANSACLESLALCNTREGYLPAATVPMKSIACTIIMLEILTNYAAAQLHVAKEHTASQ